MAALLVAGGFSAGAQSNTVPGPTDYAAFSRFIAARNIFDPNRYPHTSTARPRPHPTPPPASAPAFTLVGTMAYDKGMFAFFDGKSPDLKQILAVNGNEAGYTVKAITLKEVKLEGADKQEINLKVGDQMRQEGTNWVFAGQASVSGSSVADSSAATTGGGPDAAAAPAGVPPAIENNDILKRLMQKREQELK